MKTEKLIVLIIIAAVLCVGAVMVYQSRNTASRVKKIEGASAGDMLLPELKNSVEAVARIEIIDDEGSLIIARSDDNEWILENRDNYPVDSTKINKLFVDLTDIRIGDRLTDKKEKYENFGLAGERGSAGTIIIRNKSGREIVSLLIGEERKPQESNPDMMMGPGGQFFLRGNDPAVYLASAALYWINPRTSSWVNTNVMSLSSNDIMTVSVDHNSTETFTMSWKDGKPVMTDLESGMELKMPAVSALKSAPASLYLNDVIGAESEKAKGLNFDTVFSTNLKDGTCYIIRLTRDEEKYYMALSAVYDEPYITDEDQASTATLAAVEEKASKAREAVPDFNKKHSAWIYEIMQWNYEKLAKKRSEFIQEAAVKEE